MFSALARFVTKNPYSKKYEGIYLNIPRPFRVIPSFKERVWGVEDITAWFAEAPPQQVLGEAWFTAPENRLESGLSLDALFQQDPQFLGTGADPLHPGLCPLLVKFLFTSARLSVQVHPSDEYAQKHHASLGKSEAWYIIDAQLGAEVALGFREQLSPERFREAAESGEIEQLLDWKAVQAGDTVFVPAGTVHAIGAGVTVCEIQQNSDITYRLYDYGRPRELHLDHGQMVAELGPYRHGMSRRELGPGRTSLVECQYFRIERFVQTGAKLFLGGNLPHYSLLISLSGEGSIDGRPFARGQVWFIPAGAPEVEIDSDAGEFLLTYIGSAQPPPLRTA